MPTYEWRSWSGSQNSIEAAKVTFEPGGTLAFWGPVREGPLSAMPRPLVLAVKAGDWKDLREVEA